jgi:FAD:protein FMN transferase
MQKANNTKTLEALGSVWNVQIWDDIAASAFEELMQEVEKKLRDFESVYSRFDSSSLLSSFETQTGIIEVPHSCTKILAIYQKLYVATNGLFTPLIGGLLSDLGYNKDYTFTKKDVVLPVPPLRQILEIIDETHIKLYKKARLDFGGLGKGYMVDAIHNLFETENIQHYLINGSGDMLQRGPQLVTIGLENPNDISMVVGSVAIQNISLCSSANNKRSWSGYGHTLNPVTQTTPTNILATWVIAKETVVADALCTCLFFTDPNILLQQFDFEYCVLTNDMQVQYSRGFGGEYY